MVKLISGLFFFAALNSIAAQNAEMAITTVHYNFIHVVDSTKPENALREEGVLYIGKTTSLYTSYDALLREERIQNLLATHPGMKVSRLTMNYGTPLTFFRDNLEKILKNRALFEGNNYVIEEKLPEIDWKISNETKSIGGYPCQKAITIFRGRIYEAWFCSQLPFSSGPWKLAGLPGLILEASDSKKEIVFTFKSINNTNENPQIPIKLPDNVLKTSFRELALAVEQFVNGNTSPGISSAKTLSDNNSSLPTKRWIFNNPIEKN